MIFEQLNPNACRTYLIGNERNVVMVDPVIDHFNDYLDLLKSRNLTLTHVIDTHTHADHISAASSLKDVTNCEYIMHVNAPPKCVTIHIQDDEVLTLNGLKFQFLYTPGHTKDSISIIVEDKFLTGDFLFLDDGGAGRDDLPGGNPKEHWKSIEKMHQLPENLMVYPAHEYRNRQPSSISHQKETNPHLQKKSEEDFVKYIEDLKLGPADWMVDVLKANYACAKDPNAAWIPLDLPACEVKGTMDKGVNELEVDMITPAELKQLIRTNPDLILVDVREESELTDSLGALDHIIHIPIAKLNQEKKQLEQYKDKMIVVICRSGARATTGAQILLKSGFSNIRVLNGGMMAFRSL